jgi:hypothetical protein
MDILGAKTTGIRKVWSEHISRYYVCMDVRSWLRHYATSRKVADSNPDEGINFFNLLKPSSRTMALGGRLSF